MYPYISLLGRAIPAYGLFMALGFVMAFTISALRAKKQGLSIDNLFIIAGFVILGGIAGAKLLYVFVTYTPSQLLYLFKQGDLSALDGGGLVFYGGLIGGIICAYPGAKLADTRLKLYFNAVVPSIPFAHALGRIGCYCAGCCYGFEYDGFLASKHYIVNNDVVVTASAFPVQLVEVLLNVFLGIFLLFYAKKRSSTLPVYMILYAVMRFWLEFLRGDAKRGGIGFLSTSQMISCAVFVVCMIYLIVSYVKKERLQSAYNK